MLWPAEGDECGAGLTPVTVCLPDGGPRPPPLPDCGEVGEDCCAGAECTEGECRDGVRSTHAPMRVRVSITPDPVCVAPLTSAASGASRSKTSTPATKTLHFKVLPDL